MSTTLKVTASKSAAQATLGSLKRKRGWKTDILAFAADESSDEDQGDDREVPENLAEGGEEEEEGEEGEEDGLASTSTGKGGVKKDTSKDHSRPLTRDQILMRELDLSSRPDPALYSKPPTIKPKSKPKTKSKFPSKSITNTNTKTGKGSSVAWGIKSVGGKTAGTLTMASSSGGGAGKAGDKAKRPNWNTTGSKKTSIQQKISSFATVQKRSISASSSGPTEASSSSFPLATKSHPKSTKDKVAASGKGSGNSKSSSSDTNEDRIHFGTLPDLKSSEAKSYPIVKGFEKQRALPTVSKQVKREHGEIGSTSKGVPRQNLLGGTDEGLEFKAVKGLEISDEEVIECLNPKRTNRHKAGEQAYRDVSKQMSGQEKLQKYRLVGANIATEPQAEGTDVAPELTGPKNDDVAGEEFSDHLQDAEVDSSATKFDIEQPGTGRAVHAAIFSVPDNDFGNQSTSSETVRHEEDHSWRLTSEQCPTFPTPHAYVAEETPSSPSPVRPPVQTEFMGRKTIPAKSFGAGPRTRPLGSTASQKIVGPSEGIARRAFEIATEKAQDRHIDHDEQAVWSTLPNRKSIPLTMSRSKKSSAPFFLPGGLFAKRQPKSVVSSTPPRPQPQRSLGERLAEQDNSGEKSSPLRKITMFKPSRNPKLPRPLDNEPLSPSQHLKKTPAYGQREVSVDIRPARQGTPLTEETSDLPGTTAISHVLLEAPYSDPLAPPPNQLMWTTDILRHRAPYVRFRYLQAVKDELEHTPSAFIDVKTGIHACLLETFPLRQQIKDVLISWYEGRSI